MCLFFSFHLACAVGNELIVDVLLKYSDDVSDLTIQGKFINIFLFCNIKKPKNLFSIV